MALTFIDRLHLLNTVEVGAKNQLWACVSGKIESGEYYTPVGVTGNASKSANDPAKAVELWEWTEAELSKAGFAGWP